MTRMHRVVLFAVFVMLLAGCASKPTLDHESAQRASKLNAQLGLAYMSQGNNQLAMTKLEKALKQNEDNADAHHYLAELYRRLGKNKKAERHYRKALSGQENNSSLLNNYGVFLCEQKKYEQAQSYFNRVITDPLYNDKAGVYENMGLCAKRKGNVLEAEKHLAAALKLNPKKPHALLAMGQINFDKQLYEQSRQFLYNYLELSKHNAQSLWLGILLERRKGNRNRVASYAILLKGKYPDSREAQLLRKLEAKGKL